ncbi:hypothetical protein Q8A67_001381 [Cirrhinus molitorella]|uniref:AIG1-type G domain-containing protein n=1 Tax=Cirrhinus molitorella TaxID=172907 RepID=A0AA88Q923_9TELE|nr:hypothetical protein Q8A67_001381 [Cirrhinus molitorella]
MCPNRLWFREHFEGSGCTNQQPTTSPPPIQSTIQPTTSPPPIQSTIQPTTSPPPIQSTIQPTTSPPPIQSTIQPTTSPPPIQSTIQPTTSPPPIQSTIQPTTSPPPIQSTIQPTTSLPPIQSTIQPTTSPPPIQSTIQPTTSPPPIQSTIQPTTSPPPIQSTIQPTTSPPPIQSTIQPTTSPPPIQSTIQPTTSPPPIQSTIQPTTSLPPIQSTIQPTTSPPPSQSTIQPTTSPPPSQSTIQLTTIPPILPITEPPQQKRDNTLPSLSIVLFGNSSSVHFGHENILLGEKQTHMENTEVSRIDPLQKKISERHISVFNIIDLHETELYLDCVDHLIGQLVNENEIHVFIFVVQMGQLTNDDKMSLEWLQRVFCNKVLQFMMILFTYEREEECNTMKVDLKKNPDLQQLLKKCGGRYQTCNKMMNNQSEMRDLMNKIEHLFNENQQQCYTRNIKSIRRKELESSEHQCE